ncbi:sodium transporter [Streptococcus cuniculipharyngis]|uniref:Sodium transporter n=1 Tax=Streptococcus cuniculipharyngis TaxID=1562651 RepID=A0A5C5SEP2_9STRE|nr:sodium transporter [Streptococcus cuniculipharyngis]
MQQTSKSFLDYLPWRVSFFAPDGQLIYSNGRADGSFFFLDEDIPPLEDWILQDLKASSTGVLHLPLSLESFDQKIVQSFQTLYDDQKNLIGIFQYTQEISDLLASYLEDSGQALVGWSDVTSGASISNQD